MPYPFQSGLGISDSVSAKLKALSLAGKKPITEIVCEVVCWYWDMTIAGKTSINSEKLKEAEMELKNGQ